ncbi:hypothetical protein IY230_03375 [Acholeplasma laidlawii]|uniref:hypothetical protein n=1 Tax=Acholeplasma laidlawii TaxID=2148 RepID=UPI0018C22BE7|nr:hypothetical protein [Acholeplasma laidlawii]MBG0762654.1 hypothetical protein [Acholeplasma laidlawii]
MKPSYGWLLKWILAAILIAVGLTMFFQKDLVFLITGIVIVVFSLFRVVPLVKSLNKEILRTINLIEIIFDFLLGALMIYVGYESINSGNAIDPIWSQVYKYTLAFVFLARGVVFFYSTVFLEEKTEQIKFWTHIVIFALGALILGLKDFDESAIAWLLLVISLLGGAYLIYDGSRGYGKYREYSLGINTKKEKAKNVEKELPTTDKPQPEKDSDRPYIS